ncbi:MAG: PAS domain-containing protein [Deltaproteobacteria bacterium]|nr:PAS domain-containing protein [Deltaproteobacteria bacterium]
MSTAVALAPEGAGAEFLAAIVELVAHPIFVKDRQFRWVLLNRAFCEMVGHPRESLLGKTDYDFFPKEEADWFRAKDQEMFVSGAAVTVEEECITDASGVRHVLTTTKVPMRDSSGGVTHLVGIIHDISRLKAAEEALRLSNEQLEQRIVERTAALAVAQEELMRRERLALTGQLAGGFAHQIRNPLAAITNASYLMQRALGDTPANQLRQPLEIILEEAWKANRIITTLLDNSRVPAPNRQSCRVSSLVEQALAKHPAPEAVSVVRELADVPPVLVDPHQIREALANLVCNALDAMPEGGTLAVEARCDGNAVVVAVSDTGPGIPPEQVDMLFRPLVTNKPQGLGLGLTTAQMLVENQSGTIAFVGGTGTGARFEVRLPLARPA